MKNIIIVLGVVLFASCNSGNKGTDSSEAEIPVAQLVMDTVNIGGMHCDMCVSSIEKGVGEVEGVEFVKANLNDSVAIVKFDAAKTGLHEIEAAIEKRGYRIKTN